MSSTLEEIAESYPAQALQEQHDCPICASPSRSAHAAFNIHPQKTYRFDFRTCRRCGHGWIDPMPTQGLLSYLYSRSSHSVIGVGWDEDEQLELSMPERLVSAREIRPAATPRSYFECGVGKGLLYSRFLEGGWRCTGVDPGAWGQKLPGVYASFADVPSAQSAELVVALDVLEHVSEPLATLGQLRQVAAPGARLYAAVPNRMSARAIIGRQNWRMLRPLGHVHYWSRRSLTEALSKSGFIVKELFKTDLYEPQPIRSIRSLRSLVKTAIERGGLGDQWVVVAEAR
jgi:SAM-dependent methyltransferase